jgi:hypothetical protein
MDDQVSCGSRAYNADLIGLSLLKMRRVLIGLTLVLLLVISIGVGVVVAEWPHWCTAL